MATRLQIRRDAAANWTSTNPTLAQGEFGYETDTGKMKVGDGLTPWLTLSYFPADVFPAQAGNAGKYLTTNGSVASWASVTTDPTPTVFMMMGA